jgi:hypothetical protein
MNQQSYFITGHTAPAKADVILICLVVLAVIVLQLIDLDAEYHTMGWLVQHEEKLNIPDARAFYLKEPQRVTDYTEPLSVIFGIMGSRIVQLGFHLFGFNNYGLRVNFVIVSGIATLLLVSILLRMLPGLMGVMVSMFYVVNYKQFILTRYAIHENLSVLSLIGLIWLYVAQNRFFVKNMNWIAFLCGGLVLVKQNFPLYCMVLIGTLALTERLALRRLIYLALSCLAGLLVFLSIQGIILYRMNLLGLYVNNVIRSINAQSGHGESYNILFEHVRFAPGLLNVMPLYFELLLSFFVMDIANVRNIGVDPGLIPADHKVAWTLVFVLLLWLSLRLFQQHKLSKMSMSLALFLILSLIFASQSHFYIKRALPFFPITLIFFASLYNDSLSALSRKRAGSVVKHAVFVMIVMVLLYRSSAQAQYIKGLYPTVTNGVEVNSSQLDRLVPAGSTVYMHCYGIRFFWQSRLRIISGEDTLMNNQMIFDKAVKEGGRYVLLASRGGDVKANNEFQLNVLSRFHTEDSDSGYPINYLLLEIVRLAENEVKSEVYVF